MAKRRNNTKKKKPETAVVPSAAAVPAVVQKTEKAVTVVKERVSTPAPVQTVETAPVAEAVPAEKTTPAVTEAAEAEVPTAPVEEAPATEEAPVAAEAPAEKVAEVAKEVPAEEASESEKPAKKRTRKPKQHEKTAEELEQERLEEEKKEKRREAARKGAATRKANAAKKAAEAAKAAKQAEAAAERVEEVKEEPQADAEQSAPAPQEETVKEEAFPVDRKKILLVGAECAPFAKAGGLADVIGTLPKELNRLGLDARVMMPFHKVIKERYRMETEHVCDFYTKLGMKPCFVGIEKLVRDGVTFYFVDNEEYFWGPLYRGGLAEGEQYAFFARAVCEALDRINFVPDVVNCNDWHTGMIPMLLKTQYQHRAQGHCKTVFTIHNMMYQGQFSFQQIKDWLGIEDRYNTAEFIENYGCASFMKAALVFCDRISTVSPSYAQEIRMPYYAYKLEGILNARAHDTWGIVNGINTEEFNPANDICIGHHYDANDISNKFRVKEDLLHELGLNIWATTPLIGMVTRLTSQKGIDLLMQVFDEIMQQDVAFAILGTGDPMYENFLREMENRYKGRVCAYIGYSNEVAHRIYAGADLFLMPSKFEPCGISQMIAQRYGTLPIVRETGGLRDTVQPYNEYTGEGNGFSFANYSAYEMLNIIKYALWVIKDEGKRVQLVKNAMNVDNSFANSARKYYDMYMGLL